VTSTEKFLVEGNVRLHRRRLHGNFHILVISNDTIDLGTTEKNGDVANEVSVVEF
jgi:hypothetical protein